MPFDSFPSSVDKRCFTIYTIRGRPYLGPPRIQFTFYLGLIFIFVFSTAANSSVIGLSGLRRMAVPLFVPLFGLSILLSLPFSIFSISQCFFKKDKGL